jgi:hypothetical protein
MGLPIKPINSMVIFHGYVTNNQFVYCHADLHRPKGSQLEGPWIFSPRFGFHHATAATNCTWSVTLRDAG